MARRRKPACKACIRARKAQSRRTFLWKVFALLMVVYIQLQVL